MPDGNHTTANDRNATNAFQSLIVMPIASKRRRSVIGRVVKDIHLEPQKRTWPKAPHVLHLARMVAIGATIFWSFAAALELGEIISLGSLDRQIAPLHLLGLGLATSIAGTNLWLAGALKQGRSKCARGRV